MPTTTIAYRTTIGLLWGLALWHSWESRGLFVDGSAFLVQIARREWFFDFYGPRLYAMIIGQVPVMTALFLGVTDLHLMARLLSFGLFAVPTALYHVALMRAKDDAVLLAGVIAAIAVVFMTTSFFIVGEYNMAYAIVILAAVRLATAERLTFYDSLVLVALAFLSMRTYEVMIYLGPLLAAMIFWAIHRAPSRPIFATTLHVAAAGMFLAGMVIAAGSIIKPFSEDHLSDTLTTAANFWQNMQFDLVLAAALVVVIWALVNPRSLLGTRPYRWATFFLVLLALTPMLSLSDTLVRPLAKSQYVARTAAGLVIATIIVFIWAYRSKLGAKLPALAVLRMPEASRRFVAFALLMLLAGLPADVYLTRTWMAYLEAVRTVVRTQHGVIAFEDTALAKDPHLHLVEAWILPSQSLAMRAKRGDAIIAPPRKFDAWQPFPPAKPYELGQFAWRD
jgi:hypothetical protein